MRAERVGVRGDMARGGEGRDLFTLPGVSCSKVQVSVYLIPNITLPRGRSLCKIDMDLLWSLCEVEAYGVIRELSHERGEHSINKGTLVALVLCIFSLSSLA